MKKILSFIVALLFATQTFAQNVVVVTSFSDLSGKFKAAFEKHPNIKVEIVGKTTAGIKYIQETKSNNTTDLFWASAPDAFEVLKGDGLLQKYTSKQKGFLLSRILPVNPAGYYTGFAATEWYDVE